MKQLAGPATGQAPAPSQICMDQHGVILTPKEVQEAREGRRLGIKT